MPHDIEEVHKQQPDPESRSESGKSTPIHGSDHGSSKRKNDQGRENQPHQQPPKKNVHGEEQEQEHDHRKTGNQ